MPPSRFSQVSRYRNATLSIAKAHERFSELGLAPMPDNGDGRLLVATPGSGHVLARSSTSSNALLVVPANAPRKYAKQPPSLHGMCQGSLGDFDVMRFQETSNLSNSVTGEERRATAVLAAGSLQGTISVHKIALPTASDAELGLMPSAESIGEPSGSGRGGVVGDAVFSAPDNGAVTALHFHPTSAPLLLAASNQRNKVRIWDASRAEAVSAPVLEWDATTPQWDVAWSTGGSQVAGAGKDAVVRVWDARQSQSVLSIFAHASKVKPTKVTFITEDTSHLLLTTGFSQMRQREIAIWDQRSTAAPLKRITLDVASSGLDPVCDHDRGIVYMTAKGNSSIRWMDVGSQDQGSTFAEGAFPLDVSASSAAVGAAQLCDSSVGEIAKVYVATAPSVGGASSTDAIVPCSVRVPRRNYIDFHAELYPETADRRPTASIDAGVWLKGTDASLPKLSMDPSLRARDMSSTSASAPASSTVSREQNTPTQISSSLQPSADTQSAKSSDCKVAKLPSSSALTPSQEHQSGTTAELPPSSEPVTTADAMQASPNGKIGEAGRNAFSGRSSQATSSAAKAFSATATLASSKARWSRKPLAGATPLIPAHQNLAGLDISRGPDARMIAVTRRYVFVPLGGPGGRLGVHPLESHGRLPLHMPCFVHGSSLIDFVADPFSDDQVVTVAQDGVVRLWRVPGMVKQEDGQMHLPLLDAEKPVSATILPGAPKVAELVPHPYVGSLVAVIPSDGDGKLHLVDVSTASVTASLSPPSNGNFGAAWSPDGSVLSATGKDRKVYVLDVRASSKEASVLGEAAAHDSARSFRPIWLDGRHVLTVGHTMGSMRQLKVYQISATTGALSAIAQENLDASPSILFPVWDADTGVLWLWSKGERLVSAYEIQAEGPNVFTMLPAFQHAQPQVGLAFLPKDSVDVRNVEIGKAIRLSKTEMQHVAWNVPRSRPEFFQDDVYPPTVLARQPLLDIATWLRGRDVRAVPRESLQPEGMVSLSQAPPPQSKNSALAKGPTMRQLTEKEREDQALQNVFDKAKGRSERKDPNHNEVQAARAPDDSDWDDSD